jgi:hypothetical protein
VHARFSRAFLATLPNRCKDTLEHSFTTSMRGRCGPLALGILDALRRVVAAPVYVQRNLGFPENVIVAEHTTMLNACRGAPQLSTSSLIAHDFRSYCGPRPRVGDSSAPSSARGAMFSERFGVSGERGARGRVGAGAEPDGDRGWVGDQVLLESIEALAAARGGARAGKPRWVRIVMISSQGCRLVNP